MTTSINTIFLCVLAFVTCAVQTQSAGVVTEHSPTASTIAFTKIGFQATSAGGEIATLTTLPSLDGRGPSEALAVNEAGTVIVGTSWDRRDILHAVKWTVQDGRWVITGLPMPPNAKCAIARDINSWDSVAGNRYPASSSRAVLWPESGGASLLGCDGDLGQATVYAISAHAEVLVGQSAGAAVWQPGSCTVRLPQLPSGGQTGAFAVNGDGTVVGGVAAGFPTGNVPVRWVSSEGPWEIQQLDDRDGFARAANAAGDLAGSVTVPCGTASSCERAVIWYRTGSTRTLGTLGGADSWARDINGSGEMVGGSTSSQGVNTGFFWSPATARMIQLPVKGAWAAANGVSEVRPDGTRVVVGMNSQGAAVLWVVRNP